MEWTPLGSGLSYARDIPNDTREMLKTWSTSALKAILSFIWGEENQIVSAERQRDGYDTVLI